MFLVFCCGKSSFFGCLKLTFFKISGSADVLDIFQWHNLLVTATLLSCNQMQTSDLNNKAARWLHAEPRLKKEIEKIKQNYHKNIKKTENLDFLCYSIKYIPWNYRPNWLLNVWYIKYYGVVSVGNLKILWNS